MLLLTKYNQSDETKEDDRSAAWGTFGGGGRGSEGSMKETDHWQGAAEMEEH